MWVGEDFVTEDKSNTTISCSTNASLNTHGAIHKLKVHINMPYTTENKETQGCHGIYNQLRSIALLVNSQ